jgi:hypothetical protein
VDDAGLVKSLRLEGIPVSVVVIISGQCLRTEFVHRIHTCMSR